MASVYTGVSVAGEKRFEECTSRPVECMILCENFVARGKNACCTREIYKKKRENFM